MKVAIVHDWLTVFAGAEKTLEQVLLLYPDADLYSVIDFLPDRDRPRILNKRAKTTFIQKLPFAKKMYRFYLPLMPLAIEQLDLSGYSLIISLSHAVAKGVIVHPGQTHVCYCLSPIRYAWDMQSFYLKNLRGLNQWMARWFLHKLRIWDVQTSNRVDTFAAISHFISDRVEKYYKRDSTVIYPPVDVNRFTLGEHREDFYLAASRLVPYKRMDLIIKTFASTPQRQLVIIGDGPEMKRLKKLASPNITFLGHQPEEKIREIMGKAKAFIFAAKEDFGIVPIEAQACGTPVIAFGEGGALETILSSENESPTGHFFTSQTPESLEEAICSFEKNEGKFQPHLCRANAMRFSQERFREEFKHFINQVTRIKK